MTISQDKHLRQVIAAAEAYMAAVAGLADINPTTKLTYFEESPTKNDEAFRRWIELNDSGKALTAAIAKATGTPLQAGCR